MDRAAGWGVSNVFREPLLHFLVIGVAIFAFYGLVTPPEPVRSARIIEVTLTQRDQLAAQFEAVWRRPPTDTELAGLVDGFVREEVYYREALALGLDRDDTVIRRRLQQKMEFLADAGAASLTADETALRAHLANNIDRFTPPARITFRQVLLAGDDPQSILAKLAEGADPEAFGRGTLLPPIMEAAPSTAVDGTFGDGFFAALAALAPGVWSGPIESAFGQHLVEVTEVVPSTPPALEAVRELVEEDWRRETTEAFRTERYQMLRDSYEVVLPPPPKP